MDPESCLRSSISVCESSSGSVLVTDVKGDTVSQNVLVEKNETKRQQGNENDSLMAPTHVSASVTKESDASTEAKVEEFHVVDLSSCGGESDDNGQSICRICHFGSDDQTPDRVSGKTVNLELIEIGCKCKNELGLAHLHCAEAWFKLRGNSVCEICGCTAKNVTVNLTEEWREVITIDTELEEERSLLSGRTCCFVIVFLLGTFLLQWFLNSYYKKT